MTGMPKIDISALPVDTRTGYPEPFRQAVIGRERKRLGNAVGLAQFGVNLSRLKPGAASSQRHWHAHEDELVYVLEGELVLVEDDGETVLRPGDVVLLDNLSSHKSERARRAVEATGARLLFLPPYSPDFNPIEHLGKKVKKEATHLKHFPEFTDLQQEVDRALLHFAHTPREITVLMARYCEKLGKVDKAA